jgi:hypothetical protein
MKYTRPSLVHYRIAQIVSWVVATFIFRRKILRNEIKGKRGPFVVIANHQAKYDFVNLIGANSRPMTFVISNSMYNSMPITGFLNKMGVIPKQQFQTTVRDMKRMKAVIERGEPLVIYPAGLMCEDGISTPVPAATYKVLKWLKADVYVARTSGTYFAMPKWAKGLRPGRTYLDVYKLFSKEELETLDVDVIKEKTDEAILFDAYREQEELLVKYKGSDNIQGLENVLYMCPNCMSEFSMQVKDGNTIYCSECGYEQVSDEYAFLHNRRGVGKELRYVSDWSRLIYEGLKEKISRGRENVLSAKTKIHMIDYSKHKFVEVGDGVVSLSEEHFQIDGRINGDDVSLQMPIANIPTLPFGPGKYLEIQNGEDIYRCVLDGGRLVMKYINMVKIFYELSKSGMESSGVARAK